MYFHRYDNMRKIYENKFKTYDDEGYGHLRNCNRLHSSFLYTLNT